MKRQYSKKRGRSSRRKKSRNQRRRRQRTQKRGGAQPLSRQNLPTINMCVTNAINGSNGRWSSDFTVCTGEICKMKVSASNNEGNQALMSNFVQNLQQKTQEINNDLHSRMETPISIRNLQVLEITQEEARTMTEISGFFSFDYDLEEDIEYWNDAIHKLITFSVV